MTRNKDYCWFVLNKKRDNRTSYEIEIDGESYTKTKLEQLANKMIKAYMNEKSIKASDFDYDRFVVDVIGRYMHSKTMLCGYNSDERAFKYYQEIKDKFLTQKGLYENSGKISYYAVFDILYGMCMIFTNTAECLEDKNAVVTMKKLSINIESVIRIVECNLSKSAEQEKVMQWRKLKNRQSNSKLGKIVKYINPFYTVAFKVSDYIDGRIISKMSVNEQMFSYLGYMLIATYIRNSEMEEEFGYGW